MRKNQLCGRHSLVEQLEARWLLSNSSPVQVFSGSPISAKVGQVLTIGNVAYFSADDGIHGIELWKTDGTAEGTVIVKDIRAGSANSYPVDLVNVNGTLFFIANDGTHGWEVWKSDGTVAGTVMVKDIYSGSYSYFSYPYTMVGNSSNPDQLTNVNGTLFFTANDGVHGTALWKSDGTMAGTVMVKDIDPNDSASRDPGYLTNVNGTLFFRADDGVHGSELWKSDGSAAGTVLVKDISPGSSSSIGLGLVNFISFNGSLFFTATDANHGTELWQSDGSAAGTVMVKDLLLGAASSGPWQFTIANNMLFFIAADGHQYPGLWKTDGTADGTILLTENNDIASDLMAVNDKLYFKIDFHLWKSDGTALGTAQVSDSLIPYQMVNFDGTLFLEGRDTTHGYGLWKSDGTQGGTQVVDLPASLNGSSQYYLFNLNGSLLFFTSVPLRGDELWKTDGTTAGTVRVKNINEQEYPLVKPRELTNVGGTLFFVSNNFGPALYKTDNASHSTVLIREFEDVRYLTDVDGTLFFIGEGFSGGYGLWKSDGTYNGTVQVTNLATPASGNQLPNQLTNVNGTLFFSGYDAIHGQELWKSDGTAAGTMMVADLNPGSFNSSPRELTNVNGVLYFATVTGLWRTDGTTGGTTKLRNGSLAQLTDVNGTLFFLDHAELWKSDGTVGGTVFVNDFNPGLYSSNFPFSLTNDNGTLFFFATDRTNGNALWKSDGTETGTTLVKTFNGMPWHISQQHEIVDVEGSLFFVADDGIHGAELWKSDGTTSGTVMVKDIYPGGSTYYGYTSPYSSHPMWLTNMNGTVYFWAAEPEHGRELWKSDGTEAGTVLVADLNPGPRDSASYATDTVNVSGAMFFVAYDASNKTRLFRVGAEIGDFNQDGHVNAGDIGAAMQALANPSAYESKYGVSAANLQILGNVNGSGGFTNADLQALLNQLKNSASTGSGNGNGSLSSEDQMGSSGPAETSQATVAISPIAATEQPPAIADTSSPSLPADDTTPAPAPSTNDNLKIALITSAKDLPGSANYFGADNRQLKQDRIVANQHVLLSDVMPSWLLSLSALDHVLQEATDHQHRHKSLRNNANSSDFTDSLRLPECLILK